MLSISFSVFHSVVYLRTKQGRKNWLRSASNIFVTLILIKMASLRRNNVSQPMSLISEETNIFVSTMLIIDAIFQTKNILNAVNSFCWFDRDYSGIIPESQNVFLSYPGFVIRVAGHVIWMIPSRLSIVSDTKLHRLGDRARVHRHPATRSLWPHLSYKAFVTAC